MKEIIITVVFLKNIAFLMIGALISAIPFLIYLIASMNSEERNKK